MCIYIGDAKVFWTKRVYKFVEGKEYQHNQVENSLKSPDAFFKQGQDVAVQVDLKNFIGRVWNETLNKDGEDKSKVFEVRLPDDYEICVVAYLSGSARKRLVVKDQKFQCDEDETE